MALSKLILFCVLDFSHIILFAGQNLTRRAYKISILYLIDVLYGSWFEEHFAKGNKSSGVK